MKNYIKIIFVIVVVIVVGGFVYYNKTKPVSVSPSPQTPIVVTDSIVGCYVATLGKDVYSLKIIAQQGELFEGTLVFKNFEKDSSSGTFKGTYKGGILLGDYSFQSEGTNSLMQVIFKKSGDDFVRGYGDVTADGTRFADLNTINYDSSYSHVFKFSGGECATPLS